MDKTEKRIFQVLKRLRASGVSHRLNSVRDDALMIEVAVPGERWEIEFMEDGSTEIEIFRSGGEIFGEDALESLFLKFKD